MDKNGVCRTCPADCDSCYLNSTAVICERCKSEFIMTNNTCVTYCSDNQIAKTINDS